MDRMLLVLVACVVCFGAGGGSVYLYLLTTANSEWRTATEQARAATTEALAAERRLANAQTKRAQQGAQLQATVNATTLRDCTVPADVSGLLTAAANETRAGAGAGVPARRVP